MRVCYDNFLRRKETYYDPPTSDSLLAHSAGFMDTHDPSCGLVRIGRMQPATCNINIFVKNTDKASLHVGNTTNHTGAKSKGGLWRKLVAGYWFLGTGRVEVKAGETKGDQYFADFRYGAKRRYRISYMCDSGVNRGQGFSDYYPSSTGGTINQTVIVPLRQCK